MNKIISILVFCIFIVGCTPATPDTKSMIEKTETLKTVVALEPAMTEIYNISSTSTPTPIPSPNINLIGIPSTPIAYEGFNPQGFLSYNEVDFFVYMRVLHEREMIIAWEKSIEVTEKIRVEINNRYYDAFLTWWEIFQGFPYEKITIVFHADPNFYNPGEHGIGFEAPVQEQIMWLEKQKSDNFNHIDETISHWVFHLWNNEALRLQTDDDVWFREGVTTYYSDRYSGLSAYYAWMNENFSFYRNEMYGTVCDVTLIEMGKKQKSETPCRYYYYLYKKGALVSYLIDKKLSEYGMSLDDLMKFLYDKFEYGQLEFTSQDILEALNDLTGDDWTSFFDSYIYGNDELPLNGEFEFLNH